MVRAHAALTVVRAATWADHDAIASLVERMGGHEGETSGSGWGSAMGAALSHPDCRVLVAERDGAVVGVAQVQARPSVLHGGREAWLGTVAVDPRARGAGVGAVLLEAVDREAALLGCDMLVLESSEWRVDAHRFYAGQGFLEQGAARRYARPIPASSGDLVDRFLAAAARASVAVAAALAAGDADTIVATGADGLPTKAVDRRAEAAAVEELSVLGVPIVSEEAGLVGDPVRPGQPWVSLDPLDGTRNFGRGHPPWAISAGLVVDGRPLAGSVTDLSSGRRWWGVSGEGAFVDGRPCTPRPGGLLVVPGLLPGVPAPTLPDGFDRVRMAGSTTVELCRVADGAAGAFADLHRGVVHPHDLAGPLAVLLAAGCTVVDLDGQEPILVPDAGASYRIIAAAAGADAAALLASHQVPSGQ